MCKCTALFSNSHLRLSYHLKQVNHLAVDLLRGKLDKIEKMGYLGLFMYLCFERICSYKLLSCVLKLNP